MTVHEMRARMSQDEYLHWVAFFNVRKERGNSQSGRKR